MDMLFLGIQNFWLFLNHDKEMQDKLKWLANIFMYFSAITISLSVAASLLPVVYLGFLLAHIIWAFFAWNIKDMALFSQFVFFIPLDLYAMYIRF